MLPCSSRLINQSSCFYSGFKSDYISFSCKLHFKRFLFCCRLIYANVSFCYRLRNQNFSFFFQVSMDLIRYTNVRGHLIKCLERNHRRYRRYTHCNPTEGLLHPKVDNHSLTLTLAINPQPHTHSHPHPHLHPDQHSTPFTRNEKRLYIPIPPIISFQTFD